MGHLAELACALQPIRKFLRDVRPVEVPVLIKEADFSVFGNDSDLLSPGRQVEGPLLMHVL